jgi:hypothetical protein
MQVTKQVINETLQLYEKYCKVLDLLEPDKLPVLTLNETEYETALVHPLRIESAKKKLNRALGQTTFKCDIDGHNYNSVIIVDISKMQYINGLHEFTKWEIIEKRTRWYKIRQKIPHLEETLIHELVHVKHPELRHGKKFNEIVRNIYRSNNHIT